METEWMGRYRDLVAALVLHTNINLRHLNTRTPVSDAIELSMQEWQILEYIIEHESDDATMSGILSRLGIPQSSFSIMAKRLCSLGLIDRYHRTGNKKSIILKPNEKGRAIYIKNTDSIRRELFQPFFDSLSGLNNRTIQEFANSINVLNKTLAGSQEKEEKGVLVKAD